MLSIIVTLVLVGLLMHLINSFIPMEPRIKNLLNLSVIIMLVLWLLRVTGLLASVGLIP